MPRVVLKNLTRPNGLQNLLQRDLLLDHLLLGMLGYTNVLCPCLRSYSFNRHIRIHRLPLLLGSTTLGEPLLAMQCGTPHRLLFWTPGRPPGLQGARLDSEKFQKGSAPRPRRDAAEARLPHSGDPPLRPAPDGAGLRVTNTPGGHKVRPYAFISSPARRSLWDHNPAGLSSRLRRSVFSASVGS
jgi:hypothetical protein